MAPASSDMSNAAGESDFMLSDDGGSSGDGRAISNNPDPGRIRDKHMDLVDLS
jgi:hypothetical protein